MKRLILSFVLSLAICYLAMPTFIRWAEKRRWTGVDIHKPGRPAIPESGGVVWVISFLIALFILVPFYKAEIQLKLIAAGTAVLTAALVGMVDDALDLPWRVKALLPILASVPLAVVRAGETTVHIPFITALKLGVWYYLFMIPLMVTVCANVVNQLAGLNGLEAGSCLAVSLGLLACSVRVNNQLGYILLAPYIGACLGFLVYNRYPSRVFPGDVGTLSFGVAFGAFGILCNLEQAVAICLTPHMINSILILIGLFLGRHPGCVMDSLGRMHPNSRFSMRCLILSLKSMRERQSVMAICGLVALFGVIAAATVEA